MNEISISEFKAKCGTVLAQAQKTRKPIRITRYGKPVADVFPAAPDTAAVDWIGSMKDRIEILGEVVSPANQESDWDAVRD